MSSPEVGEERLEALLAGAAPATPAEKELVAIFTELRGEPVGAPASLRARVRTLEAAPSAMARLRAALAGPGLRRSFLVAAPACSLALAAGIVIGLGQSPSAAPPANEMLFNSDTAPARTTAPPAARPPKGEPRAAGPRAAGQDGGGSSTPAAPGSAPAPAPAPEAAPAAIEAAPTVSPDSVTAQGSGARVLPDAGTPDEREAAQAGAVADALADAAQKAERAADRAGVELGPPEAVAVDAPPAPACAPVSAGTPTAAPTTEGAPAAAPAPAGSCTVAADVNVTFPTQTDGATASPPSP